MPFCSACGSKVKGGESFCPNCGQKQVDVTPVSDRRPPISKFRGLLLILIPLVLIAVVAGVIVLRPAPVITVPGDFPTIQAAIDAAEDGDVIVVDPGIYRENIDFRGKAITLRSTAPDDPQVVAATVIDGGNNGSVVTFRDGETAESVLSGFTITGGSGTWERLELEFEGEKREVEGYRGGGILVIGSSPTIKNNSIAGNTAKSSGGGIAVMVGSSPAIKNNSIADNTAELDGGGIAVMFGSSPAIENNSIADNTAEGGGGIAVAVGSSPAIKNNSIADNTAELVGGGIAVVRASPAIENNSIADNTAEVGGGIAVVVDSSPAITGNIITDNRADSEGGAIWVSGGSTLRLKTPDDNIYRNNVPDDIYYE